MSSWPRLAIAPLSGLILSTLSWGCGAPQLLAPGPAESPTELTAPPGERSSSLPVSSEPVAVPPPDAPADPGQRTLLRAELLRFLDAGPGRFLQQVEAEPHFVRGRFAGWRLRAFFPGDPRFAEADVKAGDLVRRVNGRSIEQPDQLMLVWQDLRSAPALVLELDRSGRPHILRWTIVDP